MPLRRFLSLREAWGWDVLAVVLAALPCALYARTGSFPFISLDDAGYVYANPRVAQGLVWSNVAWAFSTFEQANWHPLTWISHMADVSLFGLRPGPMHLVNAALHGANSALVFVALRRLTGAAGRSALVAALFALHPEHVESVAWIAERKDVLSVLLGLLALITYERYARRPSAGRYLLVLAAFLASLLAKAMLVTLPFVLLLLDVWPLRRLEASPKPGEGGEARATRRTWPRLVLEKVPLLAVSAAVSVLNLAAQTTGGAVASSPLGFRLANAGVSYVRYAAKLLWPADLAVFYPIPPQGYPPWSVIVALAMAAAVTAAALVLLRRAPSLAVGWLWFLGTLVPVIGIVQVGSQAMADRYTYFPSIGFSLAVVWAAGQLPWNRIGWIFQLGSIALLLVVLGVATSRQVGLWSDDELLFRHALAATGPNARVQHQLGKLAHARGRDGEALEHLIQSVRIQPNPSNLTDLGSLAVMLGRTSEAEQAFRQALELDPRDEGAALGLADLLLRAGREQDAGEVLARAAREWPPVGPYTIQRRLALGAALVDLGRVDEGVTVIEGAAARAPGNPEILSSLSEAYYHRGDRDRAERVALEAVRGGARSGGAYFVLGAVRQGRGDAPGAIEVLEQAVRIEPDEPFRRLLLADALSQVGRTGEACANWQFVLDSPRATPSDRERAERERRRAACAPLQPVPY